MTRSIDALRREVVAAHRAATSKVSRLKTAHGVELSGTSLDPRRSLSNVKGYTQKQLRTYLKQLEDFRSRDVQYRRGATGQALDTRKWREYKKLEREFNRRAAKAEGDVANVFIPTAGMTIGQREATLRPDVIRAGGEASSKPFYTVDRKITSVTSNKSIDALTKDMRRRLQPGYQAAVLRRQRGEFGAMADAIGDSGLRKRVGKLSRRQFNILWNHTNFAAALSTLYETRQMGSDTWAAQVREDYVDDIDELISWAAKL